MYFERLHETQSPEHKAQLVWFVGRKVFREALQRVKPLRERALVEGSYPVIVCPDERRLDVSNLKPQVDSVNEEDWGHC